MSYRDLTPAPKECKTLEGWYSRVFPGVNSLDGGCPLLWALGQPVDCPGMREFRLWLDVDDGLIVGLNHEVGSEEPRRTTDCQDCCCGQGESFRLAPVASMNENRS